MNSRYLRASEVASTIFGKSRRTSKRTKKPGIREHEATKDATDIRQMRMMNPFYTGLRISWQDAKLSRSRLAARFGGLGAPVLGEQLLEVHRAALLLRLLWTKASQHVSQSRGLAQHKANNPSTPGTWAASGARGTTSWRKWRSRRRSLGWRRKSQRPISCLRSIPGYPTVFLYPEISGTESEPTCRYKWGKEAWRGSQSALALHPPQFPSEPRPGFRH